MPPAHPLVKTQAQPAFTGWSAAQLPPAPARLLLLGEFTDEACTELRTQGYQIALVQWRDRSHQVLSAAGAHGELLQLRLEEPATPAGEFDAVLTCDLAADIHPLALFDEIARVMSLDGVVLLAGAGVPFSWMDYFAALSLRCGFMPNAGFGEAASDAPPWLLRRAAVKPRWQISHVLPQNFPEIAALFQEVFNHPLSRELWEWKYGSGRGNAVAARKDGKMVAHYGGMYRDILVGGRPERVAQICDVMVHSHERGVLTRQGPFFLMGSSWPEVYGPLGFGFPTRRAMHVAEKMGLYTQVGQMAEVRWQPASARLRLGTRVRSLVRCDAADRVMVHPLWNAMAKDLQASAVGVKNWDFLERRYFSHPHNHYEVLLVTARFTGKPLGIMVLRRLAGACELLDVIGPLSSLALLIDQARRMTRRWGLPHLYCWITSNYAQRFVDCGGTQQALDLSIPASSWTQNPQSELFKDKWWLMAGDTDFR